MMGRLRKRVRYHLVQVLDVWFRETGVKPGNAVFGRMCRYIDEKRLLGVWKQDASNTRGESFTTTREWQQWTRRLSLELLQQSPSRALQKCHVLAQVHDPLVRSARGCCSGMACYCGGGGGGGGDGGGGGGGGGEREIER
jgi:hypothetical protein